MDQGFSHNLFYFLIYSLTDVETYYTSNSAVNYWEIKRTKVYFEPSYEDQDKKKIFLAWKSELNRKDGLNLKNELIFIYILFLQRHSKRNGADVSRNDDDPESTALSKSAFVHVTVRVLVLRVIP